MPDNLTVQHGDPWPEGITDGLTLPCGCCHQVTAFDYTIDDEIWRRVVPSTYSRTLRQAS